MHPRMQKRSDSGRKQSSDGWDNLTESMRQVCGVKWNATKMHLNPSKRWRIIGQSHCRNERHGRKIRCDSQTRIPGTGLAGRVKVSLKLWVAKDKNGNSPYKAENRIDLPDRGFRHPERMLIPFSQTGKNINVVFHEGILGRLGENVSDRIVTWIGNCKR